MSTSLPLSEDQSFEVSEWFHLILDRLDKVQKKQTARHKWIRISKRLRRHCQKASMKNISFSSQETKSDRHDLLQLWLSFASRYRTQCAFKHMTEFALRANKQKARVRQKHRDNWHLFSEHLLRENRVHHFSRTKAARDHHQCLWQDFAADILLNARFAALNRAHVKWTKRPWLTDTELKQAWMKLARRLLNNTRALSYIQASIAIRRLTNFFRYLLIPKRASVVACSFRPFFTAFGRTMAQQQINKSVTTLKNAFRKHLYINANNFAEDWTGCIADACCAVAEYHVCNPDETPEVVVVKKQRKSKPKLELQTIEEEPHETVKAVAYPTKVITIDALEESDAPLQVDFGDEPIRTHVPERKKQKSPFKTRIIESPIKSAKHQHSRQNVDINIDPEYSQSSDDVMLAITRPDLKISPPYAKEKVKLRKHRHLIAKCPKPSKRSITSILEKMGCLSGLEDLNTDESELTELNFRFDDDPSTDPPGMPFNTHDVETVSLLKRGRSSSQDLSIASYEQSSFENVRNTSFDREPNDHGICGITFEPGTSE